MSEAFNLKFSSGHGGERTSGFQPPSYRISHGPDKALRWDPPAGSGDLAIALSYHFPVEKTLKRKMQAAMEEFLQQEGPDRYDGLRSRRSRPAVVRPASEAIPGLLSFDANTLEEVGMKRKKRAYENEERVRVGSNRGNACEIHRRQKLKCDPAKCERNGQFELIRRGQVDPALSSAFLSSSTEHSTEQTTITQFSLSSPHQRDDIRGNSFQEQKCINEPINMLFASNMSYLTNGSNAPGVPSSNHRLTSLGTEGTCPTMNESQFMGFEPETLLFDDTFGFTLDPPCLMNQACPNDNRYSWKTDEFVLSILSHSMYT